MWLLVLCTEYALQLCASVVAILCSVAEICCALTGVRQLGSNRFSNVMLVLAIWVNFSSSVPEQFYLITLWYVQCLTYAGSIYIYTKISLLYNNKLIFTTRQAHSALGALTNVQMIGYSDLLPTSNTVVDIHMYPSSGSILPFWTEQLANVCRQFTVKLIMNSHTS